MAIGLTTRQIGEVKAPPYMCEKYFNTLKAGSQVVTMTMQSPYLYESVLKISEHLSKADGKEAL